MKSKFIPIYFCKRFRPSSCGPLQVNTVQFSSFVITLMVGRRRLLLASFASCRPPTTHSFMSSCHSLFLLPLLFFPIISPSVVMVTKLSGLLFQWQYFAVFLRFIMASKPSSSLIFILSRTVLLLT